MNSIENLDPNIKTEIIGREFMVKYLRQQISQDRLDGLISAREIQKRIERNLKRLSKIK